MRQIREILRQKWGLGQSHRAVAESLSISNGTVGSTVLRARAAGLEDRYGTRSTIITSQLPPTQYHDYIGDPTLADSICDRLLHNTHRIVLKGPSRRKEDKLDI